MADIDNSMIVSYVSLGITDGVLSSTESCENVDPVTELRGFVGEQLDEMNGEFLEMMYGISQLKPGMMYMERADRFVELFGSSKDDSQAVLSGEEYHQLVAARMSGFKSFLSVEKKLVDASNARAFNRVYQETYPEAFKIAQGI